MLQVDDERDEDTSSRSVKQTSDRCKPGKPKKTRVSGDGFGYFLKVSSVTGDCKRKDKQLTMKIAQKCFLNEKNVY